MSVVESGSAVIQLDADKRTPAIEKALAAAAGAGTATAEPHVVAAPLENPALVETPARPLAAPENQGETDLTNIPISTIAFGNLRRCETCGFPVSEGRRLCLDCEAASPDAIASVDSAPEFFGGLDEPNPSWVRSHLYLIGAGLITVATIALLAWRL